ncbi:carbamoyltransferase HypF [Nonomuraea sp. NN258]|nr:carbamoyltransferase HypF [Nonomuraea antri]
MDVHVEGVVQGVGFRPFVYALARRLGLAGRVRNAVNGVFIEVEGAIAEIEEFLAALERDAPARSEIERVTVVTGEPTGHSGFSIAGGDATGRRRALVTADTAPCADCLRELADPADRRFGHPFISCAGCGPRFSLVKGVPYDRLLTTMAGFGMCAACAAEYRDPAGRRYQAQPICCPDCGPRLRLLDARGAGLCGDPIVSAVGLLEAGWVVAVKGVGGYHLAVPAADERAAATLRGRKHRADEPFAVMVADLAQARRLCEVDDAAAALLTGRDRPVVLLPRRRDAPVAAAVAPGHRDLGLMLPYSPLHHLLLRELAAPLALAGGNVCDEPIVYEDADALARLGGIADAFLTHDRGIHVRADDSVVRPALGKATLVRRARGHAPEPLPLPRAAARPVLACGAELKNTFCLAAGRRAFVSQPVGDLENHETLRSFVEGIDHFCHLFDLRPEVVAHDLDPGYLSTRHAMEIGGVELVGVQHHHAHVAACLADNGECGPVIGVALDGLGHGLDGTLWGGEFLRADLRSFDRLGHLAQVPMPGGPAAARRPWRLAAAYLHDTHPELDVVRRNQEHWDEAVAQADSGAPLTSSAGRLFDAVAALLGVRDRITYDGQGAVELEQHADPGESGGYAAGIDTAGPFVVSGHDLVRAAADDLAAGVGTNVIAARFHHGLADAVARCCVLIRDETGLTTVALSGGVFDNLLLLEGVADRLDRAGFRVLTHTRVPAGDGGVSFGQAAVAAARTAGSA